MKALLTETAERATRYLEGIADRRVAPLPEDVARLETLGGPLPELPLIPQRFWLCWMTSGRRRRWQPPQAAISDLLSVVPCLPRWPPTGWRVLGTKTHACRSCLRWRQSWKRLSWHGWSSCLVCRWEQEGDLSPARRWQTSPPWLRRGRHCCSVPDGMSRRTDCLGRPDSRGGGR